jgi:hypothetical protein
MLAWWEWLFLILMILMVFFFCIMLYGALTNGSLFLPIVDPLPVTKNPLNPFTGNHNVCGETGTLVCDGLLGLVCASGACVCVQTGFTFCTGLGCVDLQNSLTACGSCGNPCGPDQICCSGTIQSSLSIDHCGGCGNKCFGVNPACCQNQCVDLASDNGNCGACLNSVGTGQRCCNGVLTNIDNQNCEACGQICASGTNCVNGSCVSGCPTGLRLCNGSDCVNVLTDNFNCASCGVVCPTGTFCQNGVCTSYLCPTGQVFCPLARGCIQLSGNNNCGQCGCICPLGCQGQPVGSCVCGSSFDCPPGYTCNTSTNPGSCVPPTCGSGSVWCAYSSTCTTLLNDPKNCGSCANPCSSGTCINGSCTCSTSSDCPLGQDCVVGSCQFH